jgi:hypothetical protein
VIKITRSLVRQVRTVLRHAGIHKDHAASNAPVALLADGDGLRIRAHSPDAAVEYHQPGALPAEQLLLPAQFLDDCEGRNRDEVVLEPQRDGSVLAECREGKVPQLLRYDVQRLPAGAGFPAKPEQMASNPPALLAILAAATEIAPREATRYRLDRIELSAKHGTVAATDGRQLLIESGFTFPWKDAVLVPNSKILSREDLPRDQPVAVGRAGNWFALAAGPWTVWLPIDTEGRFPKLDELVRRAEIAENRCRIAPTDADFLLLALEELPTDESLGYPVTIDLNGHVALRGKALGDSQPTELVLRNSDTHGEPRSFSTDRRYLSRALKLGLRDLCFFGETAAIQAQADRRSFIWMPLAKETAIRPSPNATRIESRAADATAATTPLTRAKKTRTKSHSSPSPTQPAEAQATDETTAKRRRVRRDPQSASGLSPIEQAKALRASLRETLGKTNELIRTLKRQEKQSRVVASTLASLKQLQMSA